MLVKIVRGVAPNQIIAMRNLDIEMGAIDDVSGSVSYELEATIISGSIDNNTWFPKLLIGHFFGGDQFYSIFSLQQLYHVRNYCEIS